ncbi:dienelactone hydrolase family protein [Mastigocoleus testarum]|uniref:Carboxymethylenebutenolidase n=1 Tax=Mastigocoleus testarum BC008 TaxID=371196 RepID=A0A0V7ZN51_9CYAN|nr:dienelactone hydrolase family protein [Mastigocoleus testarum]KST65915.1 carboxymethylenebutenolidase [Mastigocoleus testarum BC008]
MNKKNYRWIIIYSVLLIATLLFNLGLHNFNFSQDTSQSLAIAHHNDQPVATEIALAKPKVEVTAEKVNYATVNGEKITGYFAQPKSTTKPLPGIITIHEWWGLNENIESVTRRLAGEGYQVLAVDLYNGKVTESPQEALKLLQAVSKNPDPAKDNLKQAYEYLVNQNKASKVGVIGWCFGGSWSLQTAILLPKDIDATVIYYGGQIGDATPEQLKTLQMPILGIFGAEDASIPVSTVRKFEKTLKELGKQADIQIYENAGHAFANPSGKNYVAEAAQKAWTETTQFFQQYLEAK